MKEDFLEKKLNQRMEAGAFRELVVREGLVDFCSNDYLGIAKHNLVADSSHEMHGSTGSRLLSGNYKLIEETENKIAEFHRSPSALIFNSGYDANIGLLSCVPQRGDTILYDFLCHASIRDGMRLSFANQFSFTHNDIADLEEKLKTAQGNIFVVTESVFSMDGDMAPVEDIINLCNSFNARLIVDEAHATGVIGKEGEGLVQHLGLEQNVFARIHTYGKAAGCHGASILGSTSLRTFLINFSRPFIYTTALPASAIRSISNTYGIFPTLKDQRKHLLKLISLFRDTNLRFQKLDSNTPIQGVVIPGNAEVKSAAANLLKSGLDVRPILYPSVPLGKERLRIVLHAFNSADEIKLLADILS